MDDDRQCMQCGASLGNRRLDAVFCRQECKRRYYRRTQRSNYTAPPASTPGMLAQSGADQRFRAQLSHYEEATRPLSDHERALLARQRRNPGPLLPELAQVQIDRAIEQQRREAAEYASHQPLKVEDPLDPTSQGGVARRARESRRVNRPVDPYERILRPGQSGPYWDDDNQCIDKASIGWR